MHIFQSNSPWPGTARSHCARHRNRPDLIIADEPTGDLDSNSATDVLEILRRLNESFNKTVVM